MRDGLGVGFDSFDPPADGGIAASEAVLHGPGEGERLVRGNRSLLLKGALADICFSKFTVDGALDGPGIHEHEVEVDTFYVLDGELELTVGTQCPAAGAGTLAAVPPGVRHTFAHRDRARCASSTCTRPTAALPLTCARSPTRGVDNPHQASRPAH